MAKLTNQGVIKAFFTGNYYSKKGIESHTGNLWISQDGKRLMNYSTCLVERNQEFGLIVNRTKYSSTTSKIQTFIQRELRVQWSPQFITENVIDIEKVHQGTAYLEEDCRAFVHAAQFLLEEEV